MVKFPRTPEHLVGFGIAVVLLGIFLSSFAFVLLGDRDVTAEKKSPKSPSGWAATHESGTFNEYSFVHKAEKCGTFAVVKDPTGSGRGYVYRGEVTCARPDGSSHRLYPTIDFPRCRLGPYRSKFLVWVDVPQVPGKGWVSVATYSVRKNWQDVFGLNLTLRDNAWWMELFHVPVFGKGDFHTEKKIPFPLRKWVQVTVEVGEDGLIHVYQDGTMILTAPKKWEQGIPALCEAHWGFYAAGQIADGMILNDDIDIYFLANPPGEG